MKYSLLILSLLLTVLSLQAQETDVPIDSLEAKFESNIKSFQPYLFGAAEISNSPEGYRESLSAGVGVIVKRHWIAGAFLTDFQGIITEKVIFPNDFDFFFSHRGFLVGYKTDRNRMFDFRFTIQYSFAEATWERAEVGNIIVLGDQFTIVNPTAGIDINLSKFAKLTGSLGYRTTSDFKLARLTNSDLDGVTFQIGLNLGLFNEIQR